MFCKYAITVCHDFFVQLQSPVTTLMLWLHLDMEFGVVKVNRILTP